jgi:hypothetical protein
VFELINLSFPLDDKFFLCSDISQLVSPPASSPICSLVSSLAQI